MNYFQSKPPVQAAMPQSPQIQEILSLSPLFRASPSVKRLRNESPLGEVIPRFISLFKGQMSNKMQMQLVSHLFKLMIEQYHGLEVLHFIHGDCLEKVTKGILTLHSAGKENILYQLANIIAEKKMDMERMPFGLIDYNIRFFNAASAVKIKMEEHYAVWQETMFAHFGHKWVSLNRGPMWQYDEDEVLMETENVPCGDILAEALNSAGILDVGNVPAVDNAELCQVVASVATEGFDTECMAQSAECSEVSLNDEVAEVGAECEGSASVSTLWTSIASEDQVAASDAVKDFDTRSVPQSAECSENLSNDFAAEAGAECEGSNAISTLWASITREEANEIIESNADPLLFEKIHGVVPQNHAVMKHSGLYKPEKVCMRSAQITLIFFFYVVYIHVII